MIFSFLIDVECILLSEIVRERNITWFAYTWNLRKPKQNKAKKESQKQGPNGWLPEGRGLGMGEKGEGKCIQQYCDKF